MRDKETDKEAERQETKIQSDKEIEIQRDRETRKQ